VRLAWLVFFVLMSIVATSTLSPAATPRAFGVRQLRVIPPFQNPDVRQMVTWWASLCEMRQEAFGVCTDTIIN